jgi:hypothetical protein
MCGERCGVSVAGEGAACDAACTTMTLDAKGAPLDVGRTRRTIPPAMRRALVVRDRGCRFPGCDRPPEWCEAHHLWHWVDGGDTKPENIALLCEFHHRCAHEHGLELVWGPDNVLIIDPRDVASCDVDHVPLF